MAISIINHSKIIASKVVARFKEDIPVRAGFSQFFPRETTATLHVDIEVERDNDTIAVDVQRFTEGNKNKLTRATEKKYQPPYYREEYDFQRDDIYLNTVGMGVMNNSNVNQAIAQNALKNVRNNRKRIERAIRVQMSQVLQTGIVELKNGENIDYKRKAASMVDLGAGNYWDEAGTDPRTSIATGMRFLRDEGNSSSITANVIMRSSAMNAFLGNEKVIAGAEIRRISREKIDMPQFNETSGLAYHGQYAADDFVVNLWTYNEKYTNEAGDTQHYLDESNVIILPSDFRGKTVFGGLPTMVNRNIGGQSIQVPSVVESEFLLRGYSDEKTMSSTLELTSAPLVIPYTIDKVYTIKVLA